MNPIFSAIIAYIIWGSLPLFWHHLNDRNPLEVLSWRVICSAFFLIPVAGKKAVIEIKEKVGKNELKRYLLSGLLLATNWGIYVWAIFNKVLLASSLGYFIAPLFLGILGWLILNENITNIKKIAGLFAVVGIVIIGFGANSITWIVALGLSLTISFYGLLRRGGKLSTYTAMLLETLLLCPLAAIILWFYSEPMGLSTGILILFSGPATTIPLIFFTYALTKLTLVEIAPLQYISPTLQFIIGTILFGEALSHNILLAFIFVWCGIFLCMGERIFRKIKVN